MTFPHRVTVAALLILVPTACGSGGDPKSDSQLQREIVSNMRALLLTDLRALHQSALDLQAAAPSGFQGWDPSGSDVAAMRQAWTRTRDYWERTEGTLAPLFDDLDQSMDSRYEDILERIGAAGDADPFDREGVIGMHAVERILFAPGPFSVVSYEATLSGYRPAAWPTSDQEAAEVKAGLFQRLVDDAQKLLDRWQSETIDLGVVFSGLTGLMSAQAEKVRLAADQKEESRYSQTTMVDLRSNMAGTRAIYELFVPWLETKTFGTSLNNTAILAFDRLDQDYSAVAGDDIPSPPATWATNPASLENQESPFGILYVSVGQEVDPSRAGSAVDAMNAVARALNLPEFTGQD